MTTTGNIGARRGFTLVEVLLALVIVALLLVPLLHTHLQSLRMHARGTSADEAMTLAHSKLNEVVVRGESMSQQGIVPAARGGGTYRWRVQRNLDPVPLQRSDEPIPGLIYVRVIIEWVDGASARSLQVGRYVYDEQDAATRGDNPQGRQ